MIKREDADAKAGKEIRENLSKLEAEIDAKIEKEWYGVESRIVLGVPSYVRTSVAKAFAEKYASDGGYRLDYFTGGQMDGDSITLSHPDSIANRQKQTQDYYGK